MTVIQTIKTAVPFVLLGSGIAGYAITRRKVLLIPAAAGAGLLAYSYITRPVLAAPVPELVLSPEHRYTCTIELTRPLSEDEIYKLVDQMTEPPFIDLVSGLMIYTPVGAPWVKLEFNPTKEMKESEFLEAVDDVFNRVGLEGVVARKYVSILR
jgi:hypothetical protein